ncbi:MAG: hypothetical protein ABIN36_10830 [Ferruginibacter sp.]
MKQKFILSSICVLWFLDCLAEGQDGLQTLIFIAYALVILFYSFVGAVLLKFIIKIFKINDPNPFWFYLLISFTASLLLALIMGDSFLPF